MKGPFPSADAAQGRVLCSGDVPVRTERSSAARKTSAQAAAFPPLDRHRSRTNESGAFSVELTIREESSRVAHVRSEAEIRRGTYTPPWDFMPSGRLRVQSGHGSGATQLAADRVRWTLEDRLGRVFDRLEHEGAASEERRLEAERKRAEARPAWEDAMESARLRLVEHHRVTWAPPSRSCRPPGKVSLSRTRIERGWIGSRFTS